MTKAETNPWLLQSDARLFAGLLITPLSILSVVVILACNPHPLFALFPMPTLIIGTAVITLELRNRIEKEDAILQSAGTTAETKLHDPKLRCTMVENAGKH